MAVKVFGGQLPRGTSPASSQAARVAIRAGGLLAVGLLLLLATYALWGEPPEGVMALPLWAAIGGGLVQMAGAVAIWLLPNHREPPSPAVMVEAPQRHRAGREAAAWLTVAASRGWSALISAVAAIALVAQHSLRAGWRVMGQATHAGSARAVTQATRLARAGFVALDVAMRLAAALRLLLAALAFALQRGMRAGGSAFKTWRAGMQEQATLRPAAALSLRARAARAAITGSVQWSRLATAALDSLRGLVTFGAEVGASVPAHIAGWQVARAQTAVWRPARALPGLPGIEIPEWLRRAALRARGLTHVSVGVADCLMVVATTCILFAGLRGIQGNPTPTDLQQPPWSAGPLELSPERGHFALTLSIVEDHSFSFSLPIARYVTPDLGYVNGRYVSLFSPGMSFLAIPGYMAGRAVGLAQVGAFAVVLLFAEANAILVRLIAMQLGASRPAAWMGALAFVFASPAFVYAVSFFQHHVSLFLLLFPLYLLLRYKGALVLIPVWLMYGYSIVVDYPNALLLAPVAIMAAGRMVRLEQTRAALRAVVNVRAILTVVAIALPLGLLLWFNYQSYGNPLQINSTVATVKAIDDQGHPTTPRDLGTSSAQQFLHPNEQNKSVANYFDTRNLLMGLFIHLFSRERGVLVFAPVMFLGIAGAVVLLRKEPDKLTLILSVVGLNLTLYSLWDDPWGGWAFGSRYIVPSYAMMGILIAIALTKLNRNRLFMGVFALALVYSLSVNTLGALTSSAIPPQAEAASLSQVSGHDEKYSWDRDWEYLRQTGTQSIFYRTVGSKVVQPVEYYVLFAAGLSAACLVLLARVYTLPSRSPEP